MKRNALMTTGKLGAAAMAAAVWLSVGTARAQERQAYVIESLTNHVTVSWVNNEGWQPEFLYGVSAGPGGSVTGSTNGWYESGTVVSNVAIPNPHYQFLSWSNAPAGRETQNPLVFELDGAYTNIVANFGLKSYTVEVVSRYEPWFGTNTIGNPSGAGSYPAWSAVTASVDRIVVHPENPGMRLRAKGAVVTGP